MWYFDKIVNFVVMKITCCCVHHPEDDFKTKYLGKKAEFETLLGFYENLAVYMSQRWNPDQLAVQL